MSKQTLIISSALALCLMAAFSLHAHAAGQDGMVVVRDPLTGKLRAPTPDEARLLRARTPAGTALAAPRQPSLVTGPGGARGVRLGDKTMVYEVVTRGADGTLSRQCVQGDGAAQDALHRPAPSDHQEHNHETR